MEHRGPLVLKCCVLFLLLNGLAFRVSQGQLLPVVDDQGDSTTSYRLRTYIVHVKRPEGARLLTRHELKQWHESFLPNTTLDSGKRRLIYSYREVISGFAAKLTPEEATAMRSMEGFVYARLEVTHRIATTHTPQFLGLSQTGGAWDSGNEGKGVVIGVLDSGIWPHPSFGDDGMPAPPQKFKGSCIPLSGVTCNNKIVGARGFLEGEEVIAIDHHGHGTHVAGIAAANFVEGAEVLGMAAGKASGIAPKAHLSIYKVCFDDVDCPDSGILAAIDQAIEDRVDILSMSLGTTAATSYYFEDAVQLGSLTALRHGIVPVTTAGNGGPMFNTVHHDAPWVLTVGATSTDRRIRAKVKLGNGEEFAGESAYQPDSFDSSIMRTIVYPGEYHCSAESLKTIDVRDKIVLCSAGQTEEVDKGKAVSEAGGAAMIIMNRKKDGYTTSAEAHVLPVSHLSYEDGSKFLAYFKSQESSSTATIIFGGTVLEQRPSPAVASFSSRGPNNSNILKPDVLAPGVNILAAWPFMVGPNASATPSNPTFNMISGTSMAAPHVAGIVALIKNSHPNWSPSAIHSAIITSAKDTDSDGNYIIDEHTNEAANVFAVGAGQVNPSGALDPGLVYEIDPAIYPKYLCSLGYTTEMVELMWHESGVQCEAEKHINPWDLNYPSISVVLSPDEVIKVSRTVKHVDGSAETYRARVTAPPGMAVELSKQELQFSGPDKEDTFDIDISIESLDKTSRPYGRGKIEWDSGTHVVTTPIAVEIGF
ncbi:unnamed protein product [Musa hybrid cultivar]